VSHRRLPAKNALQASDARVVEPVYQTALGSFGVDHQVEPIRKSVQRRDKAHPRLLRPSRASFANANPAMRIT